jgi:hypothetical protein
MHMLLTRACNPPLHLLGCLRNWNELAAKLREGPRLRPCQADYDLENL